MPRRLPAPCASPERIPLARSSRAGSVGMYAHRILEQANIYNELPSLVRHQMFALQLGKMLSDCRPRRADQTGEVLMAKNDSQQRSARVLDAKFRAQFKQRHSEALMKAEAQQAGAAHQQPIPMGQIALVKLREGRSRSSRGDDVELVPAQAAESAITVSLALKVPSVVRLKRKVRDRTGRNQSYNYPLALAFRQLKLATPLRRI